MHSEKYTQLQSADLADVADPPLLNLPNAPQSLESSPTLKVRSIQARARTQAIALFHRTYSTSKAYKDFVDKSGVDPHEIQTVADFERIPIMTKEKYIYRYPVEDRLVDGRTLADCYMMTATTGSTGKPVLWPRDYRADQGLVSAFNRVYRGCFRIDLHKTLHIIQNFLGTTPAGMVMSQLSWAASDSHKMTTITPGPDLDRAISLIEEMGRAYDQIIISTYPPYVSSFLDRTEELGINLAEHRLKFVCTGEKFSEQWRNHIIKRLGEGAVRQDIVSAYGCTEAGLVGAETPFSITLAEVAGRHREVAETLFGPTEVPNIIAYNPMSKLVEALGDDLGSSTAPSGTSSCLFQEILLTADQPVPLIRYNIHDRGGILTGAGINQIIQQYTLPLVSLPDDAHFVYLLGRSDSVQLLGFKVYIEEIRYCLENSLFEGRLTGQFQYGKTVNETFHDQLNVVVYLKPGCVLSESEKVQFHQEFWDNLTTVNSLLLLPSSDMLHSGMLSVSFQHNGDSESVSGKFRYFLE